MQPCVFNFMHLEHDSKKGSTGFTGLPRGPWHTGRGKPPDLLQWFSNLSVTNLKSSYTDHCLPPPHFWHHRSGARPDIFISKFSGEADAPDAETTPWDPGIVYNVFEFCFFPHRPGMWPCSGHWDASKWARAKHEHIPDHGQALLGISPSTSHARVPWLCWWQAQSLPVSSSNSDLGRGRLRNTEYPRIFIPTAWPALPPCPLSLVPRDDTRLCFAPEYMRPWLIS